MKDLSNFTEVFFFFFFTVTEVQAKKKKRAVVSMFTEFYWTELLIFFKLF